jgi:hypothetical protein
MLKMTETRIVLDDGKYTVIHDNGTNFRALRYNEEWRDLTGDGLVLAMAQEIETLREQTTKGMYYVLVTIRYMGTVIVLHDQFDKGKVLNAVEGNQQHLVTIAEELINDGLITDYRLVKDV